MDQLIREYVSINDFLVRYNDITQRVLAQVPHNIIDLNELAVFMFGLQFLIESMETTAQSLLRLSTLEDAIDVALDGLEQQEIYDAARVESIQAVRITYRARRNDLLTEFRRLVDASYPIEESIRIKLGQLDEELVRNIINE